MSVDRRNLLAATATAGIGLGMAATSSNTANAARSAVQPDSAAVHVSPGPGDITARLQRAIDRAATLGRLVQLAPGRYEIHDTLRLKPNTKLVGPHGLATIDLTGHGAIIAENAENILLSGFTITGRTSKRTSANDALVTVTACSGLDVHDVVVHAAPVHALKLWRVSGRIERCRFEHIGHTAIVSGNAADGLDITHNHIRHAGNNGIVIWRDKNATDASQVTNNDIAHIRADAGGSGQNGNAINAFRADHVLVSSNTIADCAYSAVRCNSASNAQIIANNCRKIGEVALYAEFGFEGAVIASNLVDGAATGIEVTNFKEGGRLATVQGNVIRNLFRREHEPVDKRGIGIHVEADTVVASNTIEDAPTAGLAVGWGPWLRDVAIHGNLIRNSGIGVAVSAKGKPGTVLIANNVIRQTRHGAARLLDHNTPVGPALQDGPASESPARLNANLIS